MFTRPVCEQVHHYHVEVKGQTPYRYSGTDSDAALAAHAELPGRGQTGRIVPQHWHGDLATYCARESLRLDRVAGKPTSY